MQNKRYCLMTLMALLLSGCAPTNSIDVINDKLPEMQGLKQSCIESTKDDPSPHRAAAICTFDAWNDVLKRGGFMDDDLLNAYRSRVVIICSNEDRGALSEEKADAYIEDAGNNFRYSARQRDAIRQRNYTNAMLAAADGLNQAPRYTPAPMPDPTLSTQPSMPPVTSAPTSLSPTTLMNSYNQPPSAPMGMGQGARGYGSTTYIPGGADPNPPSNVVGQ